MNHLTLLIKPVSSLCSINCTYCFYKNDVAQRSLRPDRVISPEVLEATIRKAFQEDIHSIEIGFQGGEPTLIGIDFYLQAIAYVNAHNLRNIPVSYTIQTHGLHLSDELLQLFEDVNFLIGISLDGTQEIHDKYRKQGLEGTFIGVMNAIQALQSRGMNYNVLTVVTKDISQNADRIYQFYKKNRIQHLQFIPLINTKNSNAAMNVTPMEYGRFLVELFDLWYHDFKKGCYVSIRFFDTLLHKLKTQHPTLCMYSESCQIFSVVETNGAVYPCDFYSKDSFQMGNVLNHSFSEMYNSDAAINFLKDDLTPQCRQCEYFHLCSGGCKRYRENSPVNQYCEGYKYFYDKCLSKLEGVSGLIAVL